MTSLRSGHSYHDLAGAVHGDAQGAAGTGDAVQFVAANLGNGPGLLACCWAAGRGHDTLDRMHCGGAWTTVHAHPVPYTCVSFHAAAPPVGLLEAITLPKLSMATQRVMVGHDTPDKALTWATLVAVHAVAPPAGLS